MEEERGAVDAGLAALRYRDLSAAELERRLAAKGYDEDERQGAVATLRDTGLVDDERYAESRASALAARGAGDRLIRHDLGRAGVDRELVDVAVQALEAEQERALRIVERRGVSPKTERYLRNKGFSEESLRAAVAIAGDTELG